jgi:chromosome segregation ATPase
LFIERAASSLTRESLERDARELKGQLDETKTSYAAAHKQLLTVTEEKASYHEKYINESQETKRLHEMIGKLEKERSDQQQMEASLRKDNADHRTICEAKIVALSSAVRDGPSTSYHTFLS